MANTAFAAGSTSKIVTVKAIVISTGLPYTAGAFNTATISATYTRLGSTPTTITLVTATAGTYTSSGFVHRGKGVYEIGAPTAALAAGADAVDFAVDGIADVLFTETRVELPVSDPRTAVLTAAAVADATRDDFILMLQEGVSLPATTGTATILNSAGVSQNVSITTSGSAERITATT